jgi:putative chitinase
MNFEAALLASAPKAPAAAIAGFNAARPRLEQMSALANANRAAHLFGQCSHESGQFTRVVESLHYKTGARIFAVFGRKHFTDIANAEHFARNQEKLGNHVYANRMENGDAASGDGFRFRGRGYLQLTGRENYRKFGARLGIDLIKNPELATDPATAWLVAGTYFATRSRSGKTTLEWADEDNVEMVTRIVNGGTNALEDRRTKTAKAQVVLTGGSFTPTLKRGDDGPLVERLQTLLTRNDFPPGAIDGDFGKKTLKALKDFQAARGLPQTGIADAAVWEKLEEGVA